MSEIHVNDVVLFECTIVDQCQRVIDVSAATTMEIKFKSPTGVKTEKTASKTTDGTDGMIEFECDETLLDTPGDWKLQAFVITPSGQWHTSVYEFPVEPNL